MRDLRSRRRPRLFWTKVCVLVVAAGISIGAAVSFAARPTDLSVPAEYLRSLELPGAENHFLRPSALFVDQSFGEVYVADPGNNRVVVFDTNGIFAFELSGGDRFSTPVDVVVDSEGRIYVLGSTREGRRVFVFDFDGLFLHELVLESDAELDVRSLAIDKNDQLYLTDQSSMSIRVHALDGRLLRSIEALPGVTDAGRERAVLGSPTISGTHLYVPVSSLGTVQVFDTDGRYIRSIGHFGNNVGETNFPVDVAITKSGLVLVLDKHRFNVVCFDQEGRFLGEFGGKGQREGWFYHPTLLAVDSEEQVYIGQVFQNKVEVCSIPDFITAKNLETIFTEKEADSLSGGEQLDLNHRKGETESSPSDLR